MTNSHSDHHSRAGNFYHPYWDEGRVTGVAQQGQVRQRSCEGCRSRKMKCDRKPSCSACNMRGEVCTWKRGTAPSLSKEETELTLAQTEITRLREVIELLSQRLEAVSAFRSLPPPPLAPIKEIGGERAGEREEVDGVAVEDAEALLCFANNSPMGSPVSPTNKGGFDHGVGEEKKPLLISAQHHSRYSPIFYPPPHHQQNFYYPPPPPLSSQHYAPGPWGYSYTPPRAEVKVVNVDDHTKRYQEAVRALEKRGGGGERRVKA